MRIDEQPFATLLSEALANGHIRTQVSPDGSLRIFNYTEKAQYERAWNAATLQCRGLIVDPDGNVIARPFPKFFNADEPEAQSAATGAVTVMDKLDGSLGILYPTPSGFRIATRGSFASEQAIHATDIFQRRYATWTPPAGVTALFEIIYPENRIVLDYGPLDDLVLLGGIDIKTGLYVPIADIDWPGHKASIFPYASLTEALTAPPRPNAEGYVVHFHETDHRVKIKQEDYKALHRIVTGWNERTIWEHLASGAQLTDLAAGLPDEFHAWATSVGNELLRKHGALIEDAETAYRTLTEYVLPAGWGRKDFALEAAKHELRPALFSLLDGKDINEWIWKQIRPTTQKEASLV